MCTVPDAGSFAMGAHVISSTADVDIGGLGSGIMALRKSVARRSHRQAGGGCSA